MHGLQFFRNGKWVNIPPLPNALTINVGDQAQVRLGGTGMARSASEPTPPDSPRPQRPGWQASLQVAVCSNHQIGGLDCPPPCSADVMRWLQVLSNDVFPASLHRVLSPHAGQDRFSAPWFFNPAPEVGHPAPLLVSGGGGVDKIDKTRFCLQAIIAPLPAFVSPERPAAYHPIPWAGFRQARYAGDLTDLGREVQISDYRV